MTAGYAGCAAGAVPAGFWPRRGYCGLPGHDHQPKLVGVLIGHNGWPVNACMRLQVAVKMPYLYYVSVNHGGGIMGYASPGGRNEAGINIKVRPELRARADTCATLEGLTTPEFVRAAIVAHCERIEKLHGQRQRAAKAALAGRE